MGKGDTLSKRQKRTTGRENGGDIGRVKLPSRLANEDPSQGRARIGVGLGALVYGLCGT